MEAARRQWWDGLSKLGDPMRIVNPLSAGFRAGWEASGSINAELLEALKNLVRVTTVDMTVMQLLYRGKEFDAARAAIAKATGGATTTKKAARNEP
jgi:hypothetical protein